MLDIMPPSNPDEILYSWFSRYHTYSGNISPLKTIRDLLGKNNEIANIFFPSNLGYFIKQFPTDWGITLDYLIDNFTILPFYKPFMESKDVLKVLDNMINKKVGSIEGYFICNIKSWYNKQIIKICPSCYHEDVLNFGEAYLHRNHQIPGNSVCFTHQINLNSIIIPCNIPSNVYANINKYEANLSYSACTNSRRIRISKEINLILSGALNNYTLTLIKQKYDERLRIRGYKSPAGNIDQVKLLSDIEKYYANDELKEYNSEIDINDNKNWVKVLTQNSERHGHPIRHLLFIEFLYGGLEEFLQSNDNYKPFGSGPWKCLNPIAEHYGKEVINSSKVKKYKHDNKLIATFECNCGFIYTKKQHSDDQICVKQFGDLWEKKLTEIINNEVNNINEIARQMQCAPRTVLNHASKLGLIDKINTSQKNMKKIDTNSTDKSLMKEYKDLLEKYVRNNPEKNRSEIKKAITKEYNYVFLNDRQWIEQCLQGLRSKSQGGVEKSWVDIDIELSQKVEDAAKLLLRQNKLVRIIKYSISKTISYSGIRNDEILEKLPKTKEVLEKYIETILDFKKRKLGALIKEMCQNNEQVSISKLSRKLWINKEDSQRLKSYVSELAELNQNKN